MWEEGDCWWWEEREVFRRKSWVIAMPMLAKERDVRSQARKVRSIHNSSQWTSFRR